jgi:hypothetical protein
VALGLALLDGLLLNHMTKPYNKILNRDRLKKSLGLSSEALSSEAWGGGKRREEPLFDQLRPVCRDLLLIERSVHWKAMLPHYDRAALLKDAKDSKSFHGTYLLVLHLVRCVNPCAWKPGFLRSILNLRTAERPSNTGITKSKERP